MNAITAHGLSVTLGGNQILKDITMNVNYGRVLALVGPNGAGKSTLLGAISGDIAIHGDVEVAGTSISQWSRKELARQRSVLLQANQVSFAFSVRNVIEMGRSPWWNISDEEEDRRHVDRAIEATDVRHLLNRAFPSLSGGEKARVSLARVLAQNTKIVLLDEPTAALDLSHQEDVMTIARELARQGACVVVVAHDLSLAAAWADDIVMIDSGRIVAQGSPDEVLTPARIRDVYGIDVHVLTDPDGHLLIVPQRQSLTKQGETT